MAPELVWYASYGSNLCRERFMCYVQGGVLKATERRYPGCRDKTEPRADGRITIPHELYFSGHSKLWGGAMAFVRAQPSRVETLGRMYLVSFQQFEDVIAQERDLEPGARRLCPEYPYLRSHSTCFANPDDPSKPAHPKTRYAYTHILNIGENAGAPILTFTAQSANDEIAPAAPSRKYLRFIAAGIRETYPQMSDEAIRDYLGNMLGIRGIIESDTLANWITPDTGT
jgi:hypothetical protein